MWTSNKSKFPDVGVVGPASALAPASLIIIVVQKDHRSVSTWHSTVSMLIVLLFMLVGQSCEFLRYVVYT